MILRDRVPFRVSWWGMIAVLLLGFLALPGWSQSKKESAQLPEVGAQVEAKDGLTDELAAPETGIEAGSIKVPVVTEDGLRAIIIRPPSVKAEKEFGEDVLEGLEDADVSPVRNKGAQTFSRRVKNKTVLSGDTFEYLGIEMVSPQAARNRELRLQKLEANLQSLLGELRELRGQRKVDESFVPKQESATDKKNARILTEQARSALKAGNLKQAQQLANEASLFKGSFSLFEDRPDHVLRDVAKQLNLESKEAQRGIIKHNRRRLKPAEEAAKIKTEFERKQLELDNLKRTAQIGSRITTLLNSKENLADLTALSQKQAEAKQAEVVETKTITLVRTTYRISRVDAKSLEELIRKIVKADVLQIQIISEVRNIEKEAMGPYTDFSINANETLIEGYQGISSIISKKITVTTTPETQEYIGRLIALIEKAPRMEAPRRQKPSTQGRGGITR